MRGVLIQVSMSLVLAGMAWSQAMTDAAGIVAGGTIGGTAGKGVSDGITAALDRANNATGKAAKAGVRKEKPAPVEVPSQRAAASSREATVDDGGAVLKVRPGGVVKDHSLVPPPPPRKVAVVPPPPPPVAVTEPVVVPPPPPPPPQATPEDLKTLVSGTTREEVLKFGAPASRITMFDDGHLVEIYQYQAHETTFGVVRLNDGMVSNVQVR